MRWQRSGFGGYHIERPWPTAEGAYHLVFTPALGKGFELLVFGKRKRGGFHLRGTHPALPVGDRFEVPLPRGRWPTLVNHVEQARLDKLPFVYPDPTWCVFSVLDAPQLMFEASGPTLRPFRVVRSQGYEDKFSCAWAFVENTCVAAMLRCNGSSPANA